jgi:hypothetical protein
MIKTFSNFIFAVIIRQSRVARWFVFKPKIQIWANFGGSCNGRWWYILWTLGPFYLQSFVIFYGYLVVIRDYFGIFFPVLVCCTKKNLATLRQRQTFLESRVEKCDAEWIIEIRRKEITF